MHGNYESMLCQDCCENPCAQVWSITGENASTHMRTRAKLHRFMCERLMPKMHWNQSVLKCNRPAVGCFHEWIGAGLEKHHLLTSKSCSADQQRGRTRQKNVWNTKKSLVLLYPRAGVGLCYSFIFTVLSRSQFYFLILWCSDGLTTCVRILPFGNVFYLMLSKPDSGQKINFCYKCCVGFFFFFDYLLTPRS